MMVEHAMGQVQCYNCEEQADPHTLHDPDMSYDGERFAENSFAAHPMCRECIADEIDPIPEDDFCDYCEHLLESSSTSHYAYQNLDRYCECPSDWEQLREAHPPWMFA